MLGYELRETEHGVRVTLFGNGSASKREPHRVPIETLGGSGSVDEVRAALTTLGIPEEGSA